MGGFFKTDVVRGKKKKEVFLGAMDGRRDYRQRRPALRRQNQTSIKPRGPRRRAAFPRPLHLHLHFGTAVLRHCGIGFHGRMAQVDFYTVGAGRWAEARALLLSFVFEFSQESRQFCLAFGGSRML